MKQRLLLLPFLLYGCIAFGQRSTLELSYEYLNAGQGETRTVTLLINGKESLSIMASADTTGTKNWDFSIEGEDIAGRQVYRNASTGVLIFRDFVVRNGSLEPCIVKDPLKYTWTHDSITRKIGPYECRSAKTQFRGRNYVAWYTEGLAVPFGPWKFSGLPGAVVEIYSSDQVIRFRLLKVTTSQKVIIIPGEAREISMAEYVALREGSLKDFVNKLAAQLPRGAQISVSVSGNNNLETSFDDVKR